MGPDTGVLVADPVRHHHPMPGDPPLQQVADRQLKEMERIKYFE